MNSPRMRNALKISLFVMVMGWLGGLVGYSIGQLIQLVGEIFIMGAGG